MLRIRRLTSTAIMPSRETTGSAGYDLHSPMEIDIGANCRALVPLGFAMQLPLGTYGRITARSVSRCRISFTVCADAIDQDYRGMVSVLLFNLSSKSIRIREGERIAQLILERICTPYVEEVHVLDGGSFSTPDSE